MVSYLELELQEPNSLIRVQQTKSGHVSMIILREPATFTFSRNGENEIRDLQNFFPSWDSLNFNSNLNITLKHFYSKKIYMKSPTLHINL